VDSAAEASRLTLTSSQAPGVGAGAPAGGFFYLTFADAGAAIGATHCRHLFEPFYSSKELKRGFGVGLGVLHGVARQHGGWVDAMPGRAAGTEVRIAFPLVSMDGSGAGERRDLASQPPQGGTEALLVVVGDPGRREAMAGALRQLGYRVSAVADAAAALGVWQERSGRFDLVIEPGDVERQAPPFAWVPRPEEGSGSVQGLLCVDRQFRLAAADAYPGLEVSLCEQDIASGALARGVRRVLERRRSAASQPRV